MPHGAFEKQEIELLRNFSMNRSIASPGKIENMKNLTIKSQA